MREEYCPLQPYVPDRAIRLNALEGLSASFRLESWWSPPLPMANQSPKYNSDGDPLPLSPLKGDFWFSTPTTRQMMQLEPAKPGSFTSLEDKEVGSTR